METARWTDILVLLTIAVVIDRRVYKEEVDAFRREALALREVLTPDMIFSDKMAFDWFLVHRDNVLDWLREPNAKDIIIGHIQKLKNEPARARILEAMYAISIADKEFHPNEDDLIGLTAKHWGVPHPNKKRA